MEFYHQTRAIILLLRILYAFVCTRIQIVAQYDRCFAIMLYMYIYIIMFCAFRIYWQN